MAVIEIAPLGEIRIEAVGDLLIDIANRLPDELINTTGMVVLVLADDGSLEVHDCGLTHLQLIGLLEEAKLTSLLASVEEE